MATEQTCGSCGKPFPVNEENIIIGKNGHHISVMCPACGSPRTLSYDFLAKVRGTDVAGAREWVRTQFASGRKNPESKKKKAERTESGQPIVVPEETPVMDDTDKPIEFIDPIPGAGTEEPFVKTVILTPKAERKLEVKQMETDPVAATISMPQSQHGFETVAVDEILEQTPLDVLKKSYRSGFGLSQDLIRDLDKYFDMMFPQGNISPSEAGVGFSKFPRIPKSIAPQLALEFQRRLELWERERANVNSMFADVKLRDTRSTYQNAPGFGMPGIGMTMGMPGMQQPYMSPEQIMVYSQSQTDPNFYNKVATDPRIAQIWYSIQQMQQMQQQQMMMQNQNQQPRQSGVDEARLAQILAREREATRKENLSMMQQMINQIPRGNPEKSTSDVLLAILMKNMDAQQNNQSNAQMEELKRELRELRSLSADKPKDPMMDAILKKAIDSSFGNTSNIINQLQNEIDELKKKGDSSNFQSRDDFHNFIEYQKVMSDISNKRDEFAERKENREMITSIITEGLGQVTTAVAGFMSARSGAPMSPAGTPAPMEQQVGAMVDEEGIVTAGCMYCGKPITFPEHVSHIQCPWCNKVMDFQSDELDEDVSNNTVEGGEDESNDQEGATTTAAVELLGGASGAGNAKASFQVDGEKTPDKAGETPS